MTELRKIRYKCLTCEKWFDVMDMHSENECKSCWSNDENEFNVNRTKGSWERRRENDK